MVDLSSSLNSFAVLKDNGNLIKLTFVPPQSAGKEETSSVVHALISALQHNHTLQEVKVPEKWQQYFSSAHELNPCITFHSL